MRDGVALAGATRRARAAFALLTLALAITPAMSAAMAGIVTRVSDGDTLWVRPDAGGRPLKLRVQGIDAPEACQPYGRESHRRLASLVLGQRVQLVEGPLDDHGRRLVRLMHGDVDVGRQLVREGLAWSYRYRRDPGPYAAEERRAREAGRGLFADPAAMPPRTFRRTHGPCT